MNLIQNKDLKRVVKENAKYQKVMLIYDNMVTSSQISQAFAEIKGLCVFNKMSVEEFDETEINNGYKLLIFLCCADSYLKIKYSRADFVNIFMPIDHSILPYYLTDFKSEAENDYIILNSVVLDVGAVSSVYFARFYNYLHNLLCEQYSNIEFDFTPFDITQKNILTMLSNIPPMQFEDVKILSQCGLKYSSLPLVDYLLISAFQILISSLKLGCYNLVDVYKVAKDDERMVDKFFALSNNNLLTSLISLNYNRLNLACEKTKAAILNLLPSSLTQESLVEETIKSIKNY